MDARTNKILSYAAEFKDAGAVREPIIEGGGRERQAGKAPL